MYFGVSRLSVSKLKHFSNVLGCGFSSLIYNSCSKNANNNNKLFRHFGISNCFLQSLSYSNNAALSKNIDINSITNGEEALAKKLKVLMLEVEVMRQDGMRVPSNISPEYWKELLDLTSSSQRRKLLAFLWLNEMKKINRNNKKELKREEREHYLAEKKVEEEDDGHIKYGLGNNTIFYRILEKTMNHYLNYYLARAMLFGQNIVIDCGYDEFMNRVEAALCAKQLSYVFSENRLKREPFNIHFCNVKKEGMVFSKLHKIIPTLYDDKFPINITDKNFTELFPKEKLVYLTPHCREELREFSYDDVYIIGAMVDKVNNDPLSLGKAKALGIRMAKLPLDRYLDWGAGGKSLTLNQVLLILHELKLSGDWKKALTHIPSRKLKYENFEKKRVVKRNSHILTKM